MFTGRERVHGLGHSTISASYAYILVRWRIGCVTGERLIRALLHTTNIFGRVFILKFKVKSDTFYESNRVYFCVTSQKLVSGQSARMVKLAVVTGQKFPQTLLTKTLQNAKIRSFSETRELIKAKFTVEQKTDKTKKIFHGLLKNKPLNF